MSLATPEKIRTLQRKLYCKAKAEPAFRFYVLYDKICREDILRHAYMLARGNAGAPGVDGVSFAAIETSGLEAWLAGLREELVLKTYRPNPVRRVMIPKPNGGGERPLGIPTIRDRVVQTAAKLVLEPIFEADFEDNAYGYRPVRGAVDAVKEVHRHICRGHTDVVDADLSRYFDTIPHSDLMKSVARRIVDRHVLRLIKLWLKAPIEERDEGNGTRRIGGGKGNTRGTPQGGVASPLLANIYMNRFLKHWRLTGCGEAFRAHVVAYADDFVILSCGYATEALAWTKAVMTKLGLTLNEAKTSVRNARQERFDFLGYCVLQRQIERRESETITPVVQLRGRWGQAPRDRLSGAGLKPPQAAAVKSRGRERWGKSSGHDPEQVCVRETSESKPADDASLRNKCHQNQRRVPPLGKVCQVPD